MKMLEDMANTGQQIAGGCEDCDAYQTVQSDAPNLYRLVIHHDNACPFLRGVTR